MSKKKAVLQHVHVGAGAFGLGFVVPLVSAAGFQTVLANRAQGSATHTRNLIIRRLKGYDLVLMGKKQNIIAVPITDFVFVDEDHDRFLKMVADPRTRLLTTALRQGFEPSVPVLAEALARRLETGTKEKLYVVACETPTIGDSHTLRAAIIAQRPDLASREFNQKVHFVPCIVDRICSEPRIDATTNRVLVEAEDFAEWLLQGPSPLERLLVNQQTKQSILFVSDLSPFARRKTWLLNGPHLLIALHAFVQRVEHISLFLARKENARLLAEILREARAAFQEIEPYFTTSELTRYGKRTQARFASYPDRTVRHLPRLARHRLEAFYADFFKKSGIIQLRYATAHKRLSYQTARTLLLTTELIANARYAFDESGTV